LAARATGGDKLIVDVGCVASECVVHVQEITHHCRLLHLVVDASMAPVMVVIVNVMMIVIVVLL